MGFGSVVSQIIMFIAIISLTTGTVVIFKTYVDQSNSAMTEQWKGMSNNLKTDISITSVAYNGATNLTTAYVTNTGKTSLTLTYIDLFIDSQYIGRNNNTREIGVEVSTDLRNVGIFDPNEVLKIQINNSLAAGSHILDVSTEYGVKDSYTFTS